MPERVERGLLQESGRPGEHSDRPAPDMLAFLAFEGQRQEFSAYLLEYLRREAVEGRSVR